MESKKKKQKPHTSCFYALLLNIKYRNLISTTIQCSLNAVFPKVNEPELNSFQQEKRV